MKILPLLALSFLVPFAGSFEYAHYHGSQWYSKNGRGCAAIIYNPAMGEWSAGNESLFPSKKEADAYARNICGGGDIKMGKERPAL